MKNRNRKEEEELESAFNELLNPTLDEDLNSLYEQIVEPLSIVKKASARRQILNTVQKSTGCPVCGASLTSIRGRHPGEKNRIVCPTCLAERLDLIREISDPYYGIACQVK